MEVIKNITDNIIEEIILPTKFSEDNVLLPHISIWSKRLKMSIRLAFALIINGSYKQTIALYKLNIENQFFTGQLL